VAVAVLGCGVAPPQSYWVRESRTVPRIDYDDWDALLSAHVREGLVDYPAFARAPEFDEFLRKLRKSRFTAETTGDQRLAFWMNGYNAAAIAAILDGHSPAGRWGRYRFFRRIRRPLGGEAITLWDLENKRIRSAGDPRIHFAIVCASASCPRLASEAFVPERLDEQLEGLTRAFVNDPTRNRFDVEGRVAHLSQIFEWYAEDFATSYGSTAAFVARYVDEPRVSAGLREGGWELRSLPWDWSLNGTPPPPPVAED
jgi:hypothetical protein